MPRHVITTSWPPVLCASRRKTLLERPMSSSQDCYSRLPHCPQPLRTGGREAGEIAGQPPVPGAGRGPSQRATHVGKEHATPGPPAARNGATAPSARKGIAARIALHNARPLAQYRPAAGRAWAIPDGHLSRSGTREPAPAARPTRRRTAIRGRPGPADQVLPAQHGQPHQRHLQAEAARMGRRRRAGQRRAAAVQQRAVHQDHRAARPDRVRADPGPVPRAARPARAGQAAAAAAASRAEDPGGRLPAVPGDRTVREPRRSHDPVRHRAEGR